MTELLPRYQWQVRAPAAIGAETSAIATERGLSPRLMRALARRGLVEPADVLALIDPPEAALNDPELLPDADRFAARVEAARRSSERVLVFGDFDADGLTGLAILVRTLRRLGLDVEPYVPDRLDEGHGLSLAAVERARGDRRGLIVTVDCGTTSVAEVDAARIAGIDVVISDHHAIPDRLPRAAAIVNPHLASSVYPDPRLSGAGVAFALARLLLGRAGAPRAALDLADLAAVGSVADMVPIAGENRGIVRLGLHRLATGPCAGLAALMTAAGVAPERVDVEAIGYAIAPRINAIGRVSAGLTAARLLLADDPAEAAALAAELEAANLLRRELLATALAEARIAAVADVDAAVTIIVGEWPVGIIGLVAGRLAEERRRPAVVFSSSVEPWRGSARSAGGFDLAAAFGACADLFERFGGHPAAAGCHMPAANYDDLRRRLVALAPPAPTTDTSRVLWLDLVARADRVDYVLLRELAPLEDGAEAPPLVGIAGLVVIRVRAASGGHVQLTLRKGNEVIDAIGFGRADLTDVLRVGETVDVVARLASRTFGGYESLQLEIRDVAPHGWLRGLIPTAVTTSDVQADPSMEPVAQGARA